MPDQGRLIEVPAPIAEIVGKVRCPHCGAPIGSACETPAGELATRPHKERTRLASYLEVPDR